MKTSVLDFIDSETLREHLSKQTLEPAIECILIAQSREKSIFEKLEALKERCETYSYEPFKKGVYSKFGDFRLSLISYIINKEKYLADMYQNKGKNYNVYIVSEEFVYDRKYYGIFLDETYDRIVFNSLDAALNYVRKHSTNKYITKTAIHPALEEDFFTMFFNNQGEPYNIYRHLHDNTGYFDDVYAWIPHRYAKGDIVYNKNGLISAVVLDDNTKPTKDEVKKLSRIMLNCITFEKNEYYSCGGVFIPKKIPLLDAEQYTAAKISKCPKELIKLSNSIKNGISVVEFLERYNHGSICK